MKHVDSPRFNESEAAKVRAEINSHKVRIDRSVFAKTPAERAMLKEAKADYKKRHRQSA